MCRKRLNLPTHLETQTLARTHLRVQRVTETAHSGQSSQLPFEASDRNVQLLPTVATGVKIPHTIHNIVGSRLSGTTQSDFLPHVARSVRVRPCVVTAFSIRGTK